MRITWNEYNWEKPSRHIWNKKDQGSKTVPYENQYGFGHEEWLFNPRYRLKGFQYGYVRGVEKASLKDGIIDELYLYTKDLSNNYFLVGILKNVIRIKGDSKEQRLVKKIYEKYSKTVFEELKEVNAYHTYYKVYLTPALKFEWKNAIVFEEPIPIIIDDSKYRRYQPYKLTPELEKYAEKIVLKEPKLEFRPGKSKNKSSYTVSRKKGKREIKSLHVEILDYLYKHLSKNTDKSNLSVEKSSVNRKTIDLLEKIERNNFNFYEVKTSNSGLTNIREAIGQILEYALIDKGIITNKLILIGPADLSESEFEYLKRLQNTISINIEYWFYNIEDNRFNKRK